MWRNERDDQGAGDMEKALDQIANSDWRTKKALVAPAAEPAFAKRPEAKHHGEEEQHDGKPIANKAAKPKKAVVASKIEGWAVTPHATKRGVVGKIVRIGPFSMFIADGHKEKRDAAIRAINTIFRTEEIKKVVTHF